MAVASSTRVWAAPEDAFVGALGIDDALQVGLRGFDHGAHELAGAEDELLEVAAVGGEVGDGAGGDAAFHGGAGDGRGDLQEEAGVERFGDDVFGAEHRGGTAVCGGDDFAGFGAGELGGGFDGGDLHGLVDLGGADVRARRGR